MEKVVCGPCWQMPASPAFGRIAAGGSVHSQSFLWLPDGFIATGTGWERFRQQSDKKKPQATCI
jgi:hypothetical protein